MERDLSETRTQDSAARTCRLESQGRALWQALTPAARCGVLILVLLCLVAVAAPALAPEDPLAQDIRQRLLAPSARHWLGTDGLGRDILSRLIHGARPTLILLVTVIALAVPFGVTLGLLAGYLGGATERLVMGGSDLIQTLPRLVLALAFVGVAGPGLRNAALALALTAWPAYTQLARTRIAAIRRSDYLAAAGMQGIQGWRLWWGHLLPLCLPAVRARLALDLATLVLAAAGLGFLGLGVRPPSPEWGAMIAEGSKVVFDQWWVAASPGAAILLLSLACNLVADGLRAPAGNAHD